MKNPSRAIALLLFAAIACDQTEAMGPVVGGICKEPPKGGGSPLAACEAVGQAYRSFASRCRFSSSLGTPDAAEECLALSKAPGSFVTPAWLTACAARLQGLSCEYFPNDTCECNEDARVGTLPDDSPCAAGGQCASGYCYGSGLESTSCGKCAPLIPVGESCGAIAPTCVRNSRCAFPSNTCLAVTIVKEGESCVNPDPRKYLECDRGLRCDVNTAGTGSRVCKKLGGLGDSCGACGGFLRCLSGTCQLRALEGGACGVRDDCAPGLTCGTKQTCVPLKRLGLGQACGRGIDGVCDDGLHCPFADLPPPVCTPYKAKGEPCTQDDRCAVHTICRDGHCVNRDFICPVRR